MSNLQDFLKNSTSPILFGGAIGTELQRRGVQTKLPLWSAVANHTHKELLQKIYEDYLQAGVNLVITNTFRTTDWTVKKSKTKQPFTSFDLTKNAIKVLHTAIENIKPSQPVFIGGCVTTLEDCYEPENTPSVDVLKKEHTKNIEELIKGGRIDFIMVETQNSSVEAKIICDIAKEFNMPFMISFVNKGKELLNGEPLEEVIMQFQELGALSILLNCRPPEEMTIGLSLFPDICKVPYGAYGNGTGCAHDDCGWIFDDSGSLDDSYAKEAKKWLDLGSKIIGGCCGTTPETIKKLKLL